MQAKTTLGLIALGAFLFTETILKAQSPCNKVVVGYWHTFDNKISTVVKLRDVPCSYNVVNISFIESTSNSDPTMIFRLDTVYVEKEGEFINDIKILKSRGVKVLASIGGANGHVGLPDAASKTKFVNSLIVLIDKYGLEGLDIDLEGGSISLGAGDGDFKNPKSANIVNLISAFKQLKAKYGPSFWITMAPETAYVHGGITAFAGIWGAYLPVIYGLRNEMEFIHVQYYNAAGNLAKDGNTYNQGTSDFIVAMTDMLLSGFTISGGQVFPALREDQIAFGIPSTVGAAPAGGYIANASVNKALDYITKGISFGGKYVLSKSYPGLRGIMTWSINWDNISSSKYAWSKNYAQYFCGSTNLCSSTTVIDINSDSKENLKTFPNPVIDQIYFKNQMSFESLSIYNANGAVIKQIQNFNGLSIDLKDLPSGIYFVRAINNNQLFQERIIKQ